MFKKNVALSLASIIIPLSLVGCARQEPPEREISEKLITQIDLSSWVSDFFKVSPDNTRLAFGIRVGNNRVVVVDGKEEGPYDGVGIGTLKFSTDSKRVAYLAGVGNEQFVVIDGKRQKSYDGIGEGMPIFSPDGMRVVYMAAVGNKRVIVIDGKESQLYDDIGEGTIIFSPDSKRLA